MIEADDNAVGILETKHQFRVESQYAKLKKVINILSEHIKSESNRSAEPGSLRSKREIFELRQQEIVEGLTVEKERLLFNIEDTDSRLYRFHHLRCETAGIVNLHLHQQEQQLVDQKTKVLLRIPPFTQKVAEDLNKTTNYQMNNGFTIEQNTQMNRMIFFLQQYHRQIVNGEMIIFPEQYLPSMKLYIQNNVAIQYYLLIFFCMYCCDIKAHLPDYVITVPSTKPPPKPPTTQSKGRKKEILYNPLEKIEQICEVFQQCIPVLIALWRMYTNHIKKSPLGLAKEDEASKDWDFMVHFTVNDSIEEVATIFVTVIPIILQSFKALLDFYESLFFIEIVSAVGDYVDDIECIKLTQLKKETLQQCLRTLWQTYYDDFAELTIFWLEFSINTKIRATGTTSGNYQNYVELSKDWASRVVHHSHGDSSFLADLLKVADHLFFLLPKLSTKEKTQEQLEAEAAEEYAKKKSSRNDDDMPLSMTSMKASLTRNVNTSMKVTQSTKSVNVALIKKKQKPVPLDHKRLTILHESIHLAYIISQQLNIIHGCDMNAGGQSNFTGHIIDDWQYIQLEEGLMIQCLNTICGLYSTGLLEWANISYYTPNYTAYHFQLPPVNRNTKDLPTPTETDEAVAEEKEMSSRESPPPPKDLHKPVITERSLGQMYYESYHIFVISIQCSFYQQDSFFFVISVIKCALYITTAVLTSNLINSYRPGSNDIPKKKQEDEDDTEEVQKVSDAKTLPAIKTAFTNNPQDKNNNNSNTKPNNKVVGFSESVKSTKAPLNNSKPNTTKNDINDAADLDAKVKIKEIPAANFLGQIFMYRLLCFISIHRTSYSVCQKGLLVYRLLNSHPECFEIKKSAGIEELSSMPLQKTGMNIWTYSGTGEKFKVQEHDEFNESGEEDDDEKSTNGGGNRASSKPSTPNMSRAGTSQSFGLGGGLDDASVMSADGDSLQTDSMTMNTSSYFTSVASVQSSLPSNASVVRTIVIGANAIAYLQKLRKQYFAKLNATAADSVDADKSEESLVDVIEFMIEHHNQQPFVMEQVCLFIEQATQQSPLMKNMMMETTIPLQLQRYLDSEPQSIYLYALVAICVEYLT